MKKNHLKIQVRSAQNVWIRRGKENPAGPVWCHFKPFFHGPNKYKQCIVVAYFPWMTNGPYSPGLRSDADVIFEIPQGLLIDMNEVTTLDLGAKS